MKHREIPKGLRDHLPAELKERRALEQKALSLFHAYGYEEVNTPAFEYLEVIEAGGGKLREELFLFMDREGGVLSLRPDLTIPIARMAATHLRQAPQPQRLCYCANVFRHVQPQKAQFREFWQLGIELLGVSGTTADAEVISLAVRTLQELGLSNFKLSLNQIEIFNGLLDNEGLLAEQRAAIRSLVENKDMVQLKRLLAALDMPEDWKQSIALLPVLHGDLSVLGRIPCLDRNPRSAAAAAELIALYEKLAIFGVSEHIVIDMGVLRGLDYYTGVIFEGYSSELGYGLLGGGRYDGLLGHFGFDCPATGFALGMERLHMVLPPAARQVRYLLGGSDLPAMLEKAREMRAAGHIVALDMEGLGREQLEAKAAVAGCEAIFVKGEGA
ncbi:MAG: ATP phosphoribosyltransferase regulatory subunit [Syntrophomonadaceae bacterium]|nr:ATP phosphoribosyltransferase regulatory subunit [Syntrophomonadaceae bacterium]